MLFYQIPSLFLVFLKARINRNIFSARVIRINQLQHFPFFIISKFHFIIPLGKKDSLYL